MIIFVVSFCWNLRWMFCFLIWMKSKPMAYPFWIGNSNWSCQSSKIFVFLPGLSTLIVRKNYLPREFREKEVLLFFQKMSKKCPKSVLVLVWNQGIQKTLLSTPKDPSKQKLPSHLVFFIFVSEINISGGQSVIFFNIQRAKCHIPQNMTVCPRANSHILRTPQVLSFHNLSKWLFWTKISCIFSHNCIGKKNYRGIMCTFLFFTLWVNLDCKNFSFL